MGRALMVGGVFLLARDPRSLAEWYQRLLGWQLEYLAASHCVVDQTYQRTLGGRVRHHVQHRQANEEAIRRCPRADPERDLDGFTLRRGQLVQTVEQRCEELME